VCVCVGVVAAAAAAFWHSGVMVGHWTVSQKVADSIHSRVLSGNNLRQVVHTHVPNIPSLLPDNQHSLDAVYLRRGGLLMGYSTFTLVVA